jgi:hypothetical protein
MPIGLSIHILGTLRGGRFSPCPLRPGCSFQAERVAIGSTGWGVPSLAVQDPSVSPRHAVIVREGDLRVVQDMGSDNGIRSVQPLEDEDRPLASEQPQSRLEFRQKLCCCIGAVVLRLRAI